MNHGLVPFVPVTAVLLPAHQDKCSFSRLNRPGYRISQSTEGCDGKKLGANYLKWLCLGLYLQELAVVSQFT